MDESVRNMLRDRLGMTDEDMEKMSPGLQKLVSTPQPYKIIAEATECKYCFAGIKPGDKLVFGPGPWLNAEESTAPLCIGAIAPMMERVHLMWDRMVAGLDPNDAWLKHSQCFDPGLEAGGLGRVTFKVYAERLS